MIVNVIVIVKLIAIIIMVVVMVVVGIECENFREQNIIVLLLYISHLRREAMFRCCLLS